MDTKRKRSDEISTLKANGRIEKAIDEIPDCQNPFDCQFGKIFKQVL
jgi:hypothetical protein